MFERSLNILFLFASTPLFFTAELFPLLEEHLLTCVDMLGMDSSLNFLPQISQGFRSVSTYFLTFKMLNRDYRIDQFQLLNSSGCP